MNKIPFSQMEGILTQKKDLRKNRCFITFLDATKVSNIKEFIDRSRSVAPFYPITRGLKVQNIYYNPFAKIDVAPFYPITRGLKVKITLR